MVETLSRSLARQAGIDRVGLGEPPPPLPPLSLRPYALKLARQVGDLLVELLAGVNAVFPRKGVNTEITYEQRRHRVQAERCQKRTNSRTNNHRPFVLPMRLMRP